MAKLDLIMFEEEYKLLHEIIGRLQKDASAKVVFLVDKNGQHMLRASSPSEFLITLPQVVTMCTTNPARAAWFASETTTFP